MSDDGNGRPKRPRKMPDGAIEHMKRLNALVQDATNRAESAHDLIRCSMGIDDDWTWSPKDWMFRPPEKATKEGGDPNK